MILILCIGNPLRGDDGAGARIAGLLDGRCDSTRVTVLACHQLTPELAADVADAERVIFIDARLGGTPASILCVPVAPADFSQDSLTHALTPATLLGACVALYGTAPPAVLCSITGENFDLRDTLSPAVEAALPALLDRTLAMISDSDAA